MLASLRKASISAVRALPEIRGRGKLATVVNGAFLLAGASPDVTTTMNEGHRLILDTRVPSQLWAAYLGDYDSSNISALRQFVQPGAAVLDVGANVGCYTVPLAKAGAYVHAFEPVPQNAARLRKNVALNQLDGSVKIHELALSSEPGWADITLREDFVGGGEVGNAAIMIGDGKDVQFATIRVPLARLDDLSISELDGRRIAAVKLDIEGHEDHFLRGARSTLELHRPAILMEVNRWFYARRGLDLDTMLPGLLPPGYRPHCIDGRSLRAVQSLSSIADLDNVLLIADSVGS